MGLYSTNTIDAVSNVDESFNQILRELDESCADSNLGDIMEAVIEIHENDKRMFDSLLECDFISAVNESYLTEEENEQMAGEANEKKNGKILETIKSLFERAIEAVKTAWGNIVKQVEQLFATDKQLVKLYTGKITEQNMKGFPGIKDFEFPNAKISEESIATLKGAQNRFADDFAKINSAADADALNTAFDALKTKLAEKEEDNTEYFKKYELWVPETWQYKAMINYLAGAGELKTNIKSAAATTIAGLKNAASAASKAASVAKKSKADEFTVAKLNRVANASSAVTKYFMKEFKAYIVIFKKQVQAYRKAVIICGRYATKAQKNGGEAPAAAEQSTEESAMMNWAIASSSDAFVEDFFRY